MLRVNERQNFICNMLVAYYDYTDFVNLGKPNLSNQMKPDLLFSTYLIKWVICYF